MPVPELDVLLPSNSASDSEDYFVLNNAHVVYESNGKPASLLSAYADVPLRVEGRLEAPDRSLTRCLVKKPYKPVDLAIRKVSRFSYGLQGEEVVIWAMGEAGWFEIQPAPHYQDIFDSMAEAVQLLYFLADIYGDARKKSGGPSPQLVMREYAEDGRFGCNGLESAERIFHNHHQFLMMRFLHRAEDIVWSTTPIYGWFKRHHPKAFESAKARKEGRYNQTSKAPPKSVSAPVATQPARSVRSRSHTEKLVPPPKKDDNWWEAGAIYEFIRSAVNKRVLRPGRNQITMDRVAELMTKRYEIEDAETARCVLYVHADNLCYKMDHPRSKSAAFLTDEPIYRELDMGHDLPASDMRKAHGVVLRPRRDHAPLESAESDTSSDSEPPEEFVTPQKRTDGRKKRGRLSVLRPKSGKSSRFSGKGKTIEPRKGLGVDDDSSEFADSSAEPDEAADDGSESVPDVDTSTQASSPSREKRKLIDTDQDESIGGRRKRTASSVSIPTTSDSETEAAADADNETPLPLRKLPNHATNGEPSNAKSDLVTPLISTPLPTYEANGPRDSWSCTFDGCTQRIYGASKIIGRQLITEHLEDHAKGRQQVVGVVWRENQKSALPVNNLLKKIREMSESQMPLFPSLGVSDTVISPEPIRRIL